MNDVIYVPEDTRHPWFRIPGWRVVISRRVWNLCVAVPVGVVGRREGDQLWDLLVFLWDGIRLAGLRFDHSGVRFVAHVVNDNREYPAGPCARERPTTDTVLEAFPVVDRSGEPCLLVVAPGEFVPASNGGR
jgi:hypothetical protein